MTAAGHGGGRRIDVAERRARLALRHHLARPATAVEPVAASLVGLHSSDPATVYPAARSRVAGFQAWLGGTVVTPRFRTPLERRLAAS